MWNFDVNIADAFPSGTGGATYATRSLRDGASPDNSEESSTIIKFLNVGQSDGSPIKYSWRTP